MERDTSPASPAPARLFVALELPPGARSALAAWARTAVGEDPALRLVAEASLHVTLCFLGAVEPAAIPAIASGCKAAVSRVNGPDAARLAPASALWLPRRRPRVLAVELADELGVVARCQAELARELAAGGWYTPETRPYLPHVTVARVRSGRTPAGSRGRAGGRTPGDGRGRAGGRAPGDSRARAGGRTPGDGRGRAGGRTPGDSRARGDAPEGPDELPSFDADVVALMRSRLGAGGARYERLAAIRLGGGLG